MIHTMVLPIENLNLPKSLAMKFKGKMIELIEKKDSIVIQPVEDIIDRACGMFKSDGHEVERFLEECRKDKELEEEQDNRLLIKGIKS